MPLSIERCIVRNVSLSRICFRGRSRTVARSNWAFHNATVLYYVVSALHTVQYTLDLQRPNAYAG